MQIRIEESKTWINLTEYNYKEYIGLNCFVKLEQGIMAVKTEDPNPVFDSHITGIDDRFVYFYFIHDLAKQNNGKTIIYNDYVYTYMLRGEAPITISEDILDKLPVFKTPNELRKEEKEKLDYNLIAQSYFLNNDYKKYNDDIYYFHPHKGRWCPLKTYDDYNILISLKDRTYLKRDKTQIIDSMAIYLDTLVNEEINEDLLLFKNDIVFNIKTKESFPFDGKMFILNSMEANWYEDEDKIPKADYYLDKVLKDICGINDYSSEVEEQRLKDFIIYIGYMLTEMHKQSGITLFGKSQNGKSTMARLISKIKNSSFNVDVNAFVNDKFYMSGFYNERILFIDELKPKQVDDAFISAYNKLLGGNSHSIRPMQKEPRTVKTNFTTIITANEISPKFFTNRALLRRNKIMNSMHPVVTNLDPKINLDDEVQKQNNMDWLANHSIRMFIENDYRIDNLFIHDIRTWIYEYNKIANKFLNQLQKDGLIDENNNPYDVSDFKISVSQLDNIYEDLGLNTDNDPTYIDEQITIALHYVLAMNDMNCSNGQILWRERN